MDTDREHESVVEIPFKTLYELFIAGNLHRFLKTRRLAQTRFYIGLLLLTLSDARQFDSQDDGWVLSTDLRNELVTEDKIPNTSTFYKLLGDLQAAKLIEKRIGKKRLPILGGPPIYFRVPVVYQLRWFVIPADIITDYYIANREAINRANGFDPLECGKMIDFDMTITWPPEEVANVLRDLDFINRLTKARPPPPPAPFVHPYDSEDRENGAEEQKRVHDEEMVSSAGSGEYKTKREEV